MKRQSLLFVVILASIALSQDAASERKMLEGT
jgi:hypothetical protein